MTTTLCYARYDSVDSIPPNRTLYAKKPESQTQQSLPVCALLPLLTATGMMEVLMDRLADSYMRLNAVRRLEGRVGYFHEFRRELRLDVRYVMYIIATHCHLLSSLSDQRQGGRLCRFGKAREGLCDIEVRFASSSHCRFD